MDTDAQSDREPPRSPAAEARRRLRRIRWKTVAVGLVCLALVWAVISIRMSAGEDPALGAGSAPASSPSSGFPEGLPGTGGGSSGAPEGLPPGGAPGGLREGFSPGGESGSGAPGGSQEELAPLHSRQS